MRSDDELPLHRGPASNGYTAVFPAGWRTVRFVTRLLAAERRRHGTGLGDGRWRPSAHGAGFNTAYAVTDLGWQRGDVVLPPGCTLEVRIGQPSEAAST